MTQSVLWAVLVPLKSNTTFYGWDIPPCSSGTFENVNLVLCGSQEVPEVRIPEDQQSCFANVYAWSEHMRIDDDVYKKAGDDAWWNRGPNVQFDYSMQRLRKEEYSRVFLMEPDLTPTHPDWLSTLDRIASYTPDQGGYAITGGTISNHLREVWSSFGIPEFQLRHINGNAMYNLKDDRLIRWLDDFHNYVIECFTCGDLSRRLLPQYFTKKLSFDVFLSQAASYETPPYSGMLVDNTFIKNTAGIIDEEEVKGKDAAFVHQKHFYKYVTIDRPDHEGVIKTVNISDDDYRDLCKHTDLIPDSPAFYLVRTLHSNPTKNDAVPVDADGRFVVPMITRYSKYCDNNCLSRTDACSHLDNCYDIQEDSLPISSSLARKYCSHHSEFPTAPMWASMHSSSYLFMDQSRFVVSRPYDDDNVRHVFARAASVEDPTNDDTTTIIIASVLGGVAGLVFIVIVGTMVYRKMHKRSNGYSVLSGLYL